LRQPDLTKPHRVNRQWRLAFKWVSAHTGTEPSLVTVELHPHDDGTRLVLSHERLPAETVESHRGRWGAMLERRTAVLAHWGLFDPM